MDDPESSTAASGATASGTSPSAVGNQEGTASQVAADSSDADRPGTSAPEGPTLDMKSQAPAPQAQGSALPPMHTSGRWEPAHKVYDIVYSNSRFNIDNFWRVPLGS